MRSIKQRLKFTIFPHDGCLNLHEANAEDTLGYPRLRALFSRALLERATAFFLADNFKNAPTTRIVEAHFSFKLEWSVEILL